MVAPVNNNGGLNALQRTQQAPSVKPTSNRQNPSAVAKRDNDVPSQLKNITLSSSSSPPPNLPRGSIVDKLV